MARIIIELDESKSKGSACECCILYKNNACKIRICDIEENDFRQNDFRQTETLINPREYITAIYREE